MVTSPTSGSDKSCCRSQAGPLEVLQHTGQYVGKVLESIILNALTIYTEVENGLSNMQFGFRINSHTNGRRNYGSCAGVKVKKKPLLRSGSTGSTVVNPFAKCGLGRSPTLHNEQVQQQVQQQQQQQREQPSEASQSTSGDKPAGRQGKLGFQQPKSATARKENILFRLPQESKANFFLISAKFASFEAFWPEKCLKREVREIGKNASKKKSEIRNVWVACNPSGFAFVEFEDACDAKHSARGLDGKTVCGRCARVELSTGRAVIVFAVVANHRMANEVMATSIRTTDATSVEGEVIMSEIILKEARDLGAAVHVRALISSEFVPRVTAEAMNMTATAVPNPTH
ncbi:uncharacterized protein LOC131687084 [Topomyia yanbarensis]|uniref:uncharacterized protein LOC131687084 n=1 Tax=Topomyia yanbarensis TaxID=2498891 RepID=UPI00273A9CCD|nr:uncharacterized protein LOC131687084 [Topomyia yanbarensis]